VTIDRVAPDARGTTPVWSGAWSTGWTAIEPFALDGAAHAIKYKVNIGIAAVDRVRTGGVGTDEIWRGQWPRVWTTVEPFAITVS
jgi:hypothetical protein